MKILVSWLKDFTSIKITPQRLAEKLTLHSLEIESMWDLSAGFENIVVGQVKLLEKHPHADSLQIAKVEIGQGKMLNIVCGGTNLAADQKVPVALDGAILPSGLKLKKTTIRQVESEGMICSSGELGFVPEGNKKIMVLDQHLKIGQSITDALGLKDWAFEISAPANRGDLNSHLGLAREIAAMSGEKANVPAALLPRPTKRTTLGRLQVTIPKRDLCPRYSALVIDQITMQPSPQWLQNRLRNIGIRSINYVVDITNYIMADLGQPLHAFDYHKILGPSKKITLRPAKNREVVKTLDGLERSLQEGMLVIEDEERIIDLAGIMGGENSAVDDQTTTVVLQAAIFDPITIRKTSRTLGHRTEAVGFFEKGIDPELPPTALNSAWQLMKEIDHRITVVNAIDEQPKKTKKRQITFVPPSVKRLTGLDVPIPRMKSILKSLHFSLEVGKNHWLVEPPSFRLDVEHSQDCVEEIARMFGYDALPATLPSVHLEDKSGNPFIQEVCRLKNILIARGFDETIHYSFISADWQKRMAEKFSIESIVVSNPLTEEHARLRTELLSSLLHTVSENLKYQEEVAFFEIGKTYHPTTDPNTQEVWRLGVIMANRKEMDYQGQFSAIKGVLEDITSLFFQNPLDYDTSGREYETKIFYKKNPLGRILLLESHFLQEWNIDQGSAVFLQLDMEKLLAETDRRVEFRPFSIFPPVKMDISMVIDQGYRIGDVIKTMREAGLPYLREITLFDRYTGKNISEKEHSLALHLVYQDSKKTMTSSEAEQVHQKLIRRLQALYRAKIR